MHLSNRYIKSIPDCECTSLEPLPTIGEKLKKAFEENPNLSQKEVASRTGLSPTDINRILNNQIRKPSRDKLKKLAPFIGEPLENLLSYSGYENFDSELSFLNPDGSKIDYLKAVSVIYKMDWELLEAFSNLETKLDKNDITILKKYLMLATLEKQNNLKRAFNHTIFLQLFKALKNYLVKEFESMLALTET